MQLYNKNDHKLFEKLILNVKVNMISYYTCIEPINQIPYLLISMVETVDYPPSKTCTKRVISYKIVSIRDES